MFGILKHMLNNSDNSNLIICLIFIIFFVCLMIFRKKFADNSKKYLIWKIMCLIPLAVSIVHFFVRCIGQACIYVIANYIFIYLISIFIALFTLIIYIKKNNIARIVNIVNIVIISCMSFLSVYEYIDCPIITNYSYKTLSASYISLCDYLEKNYIMNEWKQIDYDKLKSQGLVLVNEAERTGNIDKYYEAINDFVNSFHDGHMSFNVYDDDVDYKNRLLLNYNDYGIMMITLDDGKTIAVDCEENIDIKNGDVITKWDNIPIDDAINNATCPISECTTANEKIMKTFYLSGIGGESVDVTYINADNEEVTTTLHKIDSAIPRFLRGRRFFLHTDDNDYYCKMLDSNIGYMRVTKEETDDFHDIIAYLTGNHKFAREMYRKDLRKLREQGMTKLILDIRNNGGGYDEVSIALASLFTKEKIYAYSFGAKYGNTIKSVQDRYILADGEFSDIEVLVLTNMRCASAGDGLVLYMSKLSNATIAGISNPAGINQETGGRIYLPKGVLITYPTGIVLNEKGEFNIDVDYTKESRNPVDVKIPLTKDSALKIFNQEDYELEWAMQYLNN